jgi:hypothetical protein
MCLPIYLSCLCALYSIGTGTAIAVKAGAFHVCIIRANDTTTAATDSGEVLCWGWNKDGQLVSSVCHKIGASALQLYMRLCCADDDAILCIIVPALLLCCILV